MSEYITDHEFLRQLAVSLELSTEDTQRLFNIAERLQERFDEQRD